MQSQSQLHKYSTRLELVLLESRLGSGLFFFPKMKVSARHQQLGIKSWASFTASLVYTNLNSYNYRNSVYVIISCMCHTCVVFAVEHGSDTCNRYMQQIHATYTCNRYMQQIHATDTCNRYMQQIHATDTCNRYMQQIHATDNWNRYMQHIHATDTCNI